MCADATIPNAPGMSPVERSRAVALLAVFVMLLVTVPLAAAQPVGTTAESPVGTASESPTEAGSGGSVSTVTDENETKANATTPPENVTYTVVIHPNAGRASFGQSTPPTRRRRPGERRTARSIRRGSTVTNAFKRRSRNERTTTN